MSPRAVIAMLTIQRQRALLKSACLEAYGRGDQQRAEGISYTRDELARIAMQVQS